jgi:hypothetical protein
VRGSIANVQRHHDSVKELRDKTVQWGLRNLGRIATHQQNGLEFGLAVEKRVELAKPGDGKDRIIVGGGQQKIEEAVNYHIYRDRRTQGRRV